MFLYLWLILSYRLNISASYHSGNRISYEWASSSTGWLVPFFRRPSTYARASDSAKQIGKLITFNQYRHFGQFIYITRFTAVRIVCETHRSLWFPKKKMFLIFLVFMQRLFALLYFWVIYCSNNVHHTRWSKIVYANVFIRASSMHCGV